MAKALYSEMNIQGLYYVCSQDIMVRSIANRSNWKDSCFWESNRLVNKDRDSFSLSSFYASHHWSQINLPRKAHRTTNMLAFPSCKKNNKVDKKSAFSDSREPVLYYWYPIQLSGVSNPTLPTLDLIWPTTCFYK